MLRFSPEPWQCTATGRTRPPPREDRRIFDEDPVRMIRAAKYATTSGFSIPLNLASKIRQKAPLLAAISPARLTEEFYKILHSGMAKPIFTAMAKLKVLDHFVPNPKLDVAKVISTLGVGEALVSTLQEKGVPMPVERTLMAPPRARIGSITTEERAAVRSRSPIGLKYDTAVNRESAYEILGRRASQAEQPMSHAEPPVSQPVPPASRPSRFIRIQPN